MGLLAFLLFCCCVADRFPLDVDFIPGRMIESRSVGTILELQISVGTPARELQFAIDGTRGNVVFAVSPFGASSSVRDTPYGADELFHFADEHRYLPFEVDPTLVASICPTCDGIIGIGEGSRIWSTWAGATITTAGIDLQYTPRSPFGAHSVECLQPSNLFCDTYAEVLDETVNLRVALFESSTVLPARMKRHLNERFDEDGVWPDLVIHFDDDNELRIPGDQIEYDELGEPPQLTIRSATSAAPEVILGQSVLHAGWFWRDFRTASLRVVSIETQRNLTFWQLCALVIIFPMFFYMKLTRPVFVVTRVRLFGTQSGRIKPRGDARRVIIHLVIDIIALVLPWTLFWTRGAWQQLLRDTYQQVLFGILLPFSFLTLLMCVLVRFSNLSGTYGIFGEFRRRDLSDGLPRVREVLVAQWAREMCLLISVWFVLAAMTTGPLWSFGLLATAFLFGESYFASVSAAAVLFYSNVTVVWTAWFFLHVAVGAALMVYMLLYVYIPVGFYICFFLGMTPWFGTVLLVLLSVAVWVYVVRGHIVSMRDESKKNQ